MSGENLSQKHIDEIINSWNQRGYLPKMDQKTTLPKPKLITTVNKKPFPIKMDGEDYVIVNFRRVFSSYVRENELSQTYRFFPKKFLNFSSDKILREALSNPEIRNKIKSSEYSALAKADIYHVEGESKLIHRIIPVLLIPEADPEMLRQWELAHEKRRKETVTLFGYF